MVRRQPASHASLPNVPEVRRTPRVSRAPLLLFALGAVLLCVGGFSCERAPAEPAVDYLPIDALE